MFKKNTKRIIFLLHIIIAASPYVLICYLFKTWVDNGEVADISVVTALYYWLGINPSIKYITPGLEGLYNLYVFLLKTPLLFWVFPLSIPSFMKVYQKAKE
jgi:hypothetical protein